MPNHTWKPIEDLPNDLKWERFDLHTLRSEWVNLRVVIEKDMEVKQFNEKLAREWAIETGIIERLYSIDRGTTELLIEKGLDEALMEHDSTDRPVSEVMQFLKDHREALEGIFSFVKGDRVLTTSYIKELHHALTRNQLTVTAYDQFHNRLEVSLIHGDWKRHPNNPMREDGSIHEYCPPEHVASEMDRLINMHLLHARQKISPEIEAAWLHHRFTEIHPFQDGNGRVARALASIILLRSGSFPLSINRDKRNDYLNALETADKGDIIPLIGFFADIESKRLWQAISLKESIVLKEPTSVIEKGIERLRNGQNISRETFEKLLKAVLLLQTIARQEFSLVQRELTQKLSSINLRYKADILEGRTVPSPLPTAESYDHLTKKFCKELGYETNVKLFHNWISLEIAEEKQTKIYITFTVLGENFIGLLGAIAFIIQGDKNPGNSSTISLLSENLFQFASENTEADQERFRDWIKNWFIKGLEQWEKSV